MPTCLDELLGEVGKLALAEGEDWRLAHPELMDAYQAACEGAITMRDVPDWSFLARSSPTGIASDTATQLLLYALVRLLEPTLVVETGCDVGRTSHVIGQALVANGRGVLVGCDTDPASVAAATRLCIDLPASFVHCQGVDLPELHLADLVFFDSSFGGRVAEMSRLRQGAVGVLHDWQQCIPELPTAVRRFAHHLLLPAPPGVALFWR